jgi:hypothetical protein
MGLKAEQPRVGTFSDWHRIEGTLKLANARLSEVQQSLDAAFHGEASLSAMDQQRILSRLEEAHEVIEELLSAPPAHP